MPLACASTLDRHGRPTWGRFGAQNPRVDRQNGRPNPRRIAQLELTHVESAGSFSLSGGASSVPMSCSSWASPLCGAIRLRNDEGDLLGRPRSDGYALAWLACAPPIEGPSVSAEQRSERALPVRDVPHGRLGHGNTSSVGEDVGGHDDRPGL